MARKFDLPKQSSPEPWSMFRVASPTVLSVATLIFINLLRALSTRYILLSLALVGGALLGVMAAISAANWWRRRAPRGVFSVEVGADGVLVGERFVAYAEIKGVYHMYGEGGPLNPARSDVDVEYQASHKWTLSLWLAGGEMLEVVTKWSGGEDPFGAELAALIKGALSARAGRHDSEGAEAALARAERTGPEWLEALRGMGSGVGASYRNAAANAEAFAQLLDDSGAKPSNRAAAAVVLSAAGDQTAAARLRVAAEAMAAPRVRVALKNVADETAVAEALEELETLEGLEAAARKQLERCFADSLPAESAAGATLGAFETKRKARAGGRPRPGLCQPYLASSNARASGARFERAPSGREARRATDCSTPKHGAPGGRRPPRAPINTP